MSFFRSHRQIAACVAMAALLLQLVAAFGHTHLRETTAPQAISTVLLADAGTEIDVQTMLGAVAPEHAPQHTPGSLPDDCAICLAAHLLGHVHIAAPTPVPLPFAFGIAALPLWTETTLDELSRFAFQSRGPPHA